MTIRVLYVGGVPRSGSTLTDLLMDRLPGHQAVGELFYVFRNGARADTTCSCGAAFSRCSYWRDVGDVAFGGWHTSTVEDILAVQDRVDRSANIPALITGTGSRPFREAVSDYSQIMSTLYAAISDVSGADVIVDASKRPSLAYVLMRADSIDLSCLHVVRDPRGVAYSFSKHVDLAPGADYYREMPRSTPRKVARRWVTVNAAISALRHFDVPYLRVRYEDLVRSPRDEFIKVARFQGGDGSPDTSFLTADGLRMRDTHLAVGGRVRHAGDMLPIRLDEAWRNNMPSSDRRLVSALTAPTRLRYRYP